MRRGLTLVELAVLLAVGAVLMGTALPAIVRGRDRLRTRLAADGLAQHLGAARWRAILVGRPVTVTFRPDGAEAAETSPAVAPWRLAYGATAAWGAGLRSNRPTLTWRPDGTPHGVQNLTVVVTRGAVAESVVVSRLGRIRR